MCLQRLTRRANAPKQMEHLPSLKLNDGNEIPMVDWPPSETEGAVSRIYSL